MDRNIDWEFAEYHYNCCLKKSIYLSGKQRELMEDHIDGGRVMYLVESEIVLVGDTTLTEVF